MKSCTWHEQTLYEYHDSCKDCCCSTPSYEYPYMNIIVNIILIIILYNQYNSTSHHTKRSSQKKAMV